MNAKEMEEKQEMRRILKTESYIKLKTNSERIKYLLEVFGPLESLRKRVHQKASDYSQFHSKNMSRSISLKDEGLVYFQSGDYQKADDLFTKAILSSPLNSSSDSVIHLSLSFALKSKTQFQLIDILGALKSADHSLKLFETTEMQLQRVHCLKLLGRFEESLQYLNQLIERYEQRMKGIETIKFNDTFIKDLNKLKVDIRKDMAFNGIKSDFKEIQKSYSNSMTNIKDPTKEYKIWIHPNCKLALSEKKGRHYFANDFIPKGTTVLMESPTSVLILQKRDTTCHYCYKTDLSSIWPCIGCDEVIYCDEDCSMKAYEEYHHMFCGFVELFLSGMKFRHTFQILSKVGVEKVIEFHQKNKSFDFIEFFEKVRQMQENSENPLETTLDFESLFLAFYSLAENYSTEEVSYIDNIIKSIEVALLLEWKQQICFGEQEIERFITLVEIIFKCSIKVMMNIFGWLTYNDVFKLEKKRLGSCLMNFGSLLNHSCEPNVFWEFVGTNFVMTATEDINSGQELCITYGSHYKIGNFVERQQKLKVSYFFECDCRACLRDVKSVLCLRCEHCTGLVPVINVTDWYKRDTHCLNCGEKFENAQKTMDILNAIVEQFNYCLYYLQNGVNIKESFQLATFLLKRLSQWAYPQSIAIYLKLLIDICFRRDFFFESVKWLEWFVNEIDLNYDDIQSVDSISNEVLNQLNVWTNCYYGLFLKDITAMSEHQWSNCFYFHSKLIEFLQMLTTEVNPSILNQRFGLFSSQIYPLLLVKQKNFSELHSYYLKDIHQ